ncbi:hypothetical protein LPB137_02295 [Poseidonibacter parvus]|uniref:SPOR domain-containing protein n=1 Tax=Poseidonibacter parvus TaxID=1850254 RepID=A0A1P8KJS3_9BACT|nr:TolC family outer membrane protein [Poseidonibacter parvus]APW64756.1 hypothetical protein LPB137_02295 [Poseidonibacter parvus]
MENNFFIKKVILLCLLLSQMNAAEYYKKVVLASFVNETRAEAKFSKLQNIIESKIQKQKEEYPFSVVVRPSGNKYIIAVEPFKSYEEAKKVLSALKSSFPTAFINNNAQVVDNNIEVIQDMTILKVKEEVKEVDKTVVVKEKPELKSEVNKVSNPYSLERMLNELIYTDPEIKERLFQYNSIVEEIDISDAGYYPTVDFIGKLGEKRSEKEQPDDSITKDTYGTSELTLRVVQNLFNGFGTQAAVNRDEARAKAAFNKYIEVAQDKMYRAIEAYIKVIRYKEVLEIAKSNVKIHEETLVKIEDRYEKGFSTLSEVERVKGRLALSKSNYVSETNNLIDAKFNFHKALGRNVDETRLVMPEFNGNIPKSLEHATDIAIHKNPSILVANHDIKVLQESLQYSRKNDYPTLDLELEGSRYNNLNGSSDANEDDLSAMLVLNYNLYSGGAHRAEKQKYISLLNYEYAHKNKLKRDVIEALGLSWSANKMIEEQYKYQLEYRDLTAKTKAAYDEEFQLGRRTLIDLLDVQDEVNNIKIKVIHNSYDLLFSKYRIIDAMGELYQSFGHEFKEDYKKDAVLAYVDQDGDKILNTEDQCDNSATPETNIYGCEGINCIQVNEIKFNTELKDQENQLDTTGIQNLWGVKN